MVIDWFARIQDYYDMGLWSNEWVGNAVVKGKITPDEYQTITGEAYA